MRYILLTLIVLTVPVPVIAKDVVPLRGEIGQIVSETARGSTTRGTCFLVDSRHIVSACHVMNRTKMAVRLGGESYAAEIVVADPYHDRALFRLDRECNLVPIEVADEPIQDGRVYASYGFGGKWGRSNLRCVNSRLRGNIISGDSGGPVINDIGQAVSVTCAYEETVLSNGVIVNLPESDRIIYGTGSGTLKTFVDRWIKSPTTHHIQATY